MTERGLPSVDGSPACPFVAFEDDRDERASSPDHRHRCYAEAQPAPRALAHQEAYCLSSAFPVCPTFQEWARREAAHARAGGTASAPPVGASVEGVAAASTIEDRDDPGYGREHLGDRGDLDDREEPLDDGHADEAEEPPALPPRRNPPRDWAAPPPWASGAPGFGAGGFGAEAGDESGPEVVARRAEGQGLAGSAADRLAAGERVIVPPPEGSPPIPTQSPLKTSMRAAAPDPELAGLVGGQPPVDEPADALPRPTRGGRRRTVSSTRDAAAERARDRDRPRPVAPVVEGPSWERARRFEAYPQIKAARGMPNLSRVAVLALALAVAALAVFFLPALFVGGSKTGASASPAASEVVASPSLEPTPAPLPSQQTYTIKAGDTLSKIAKRYGLTVDQLLAANKSTIKDPNKIKVGDEIVIPKPEPSTAP
jgi:LysM repeat protein